ncbi:50S ribosomal protein L35 [Glycomyces albus]|uniref:50S ribosomal protein L35 n=1 Tax=Glycomyces salinus TaxID=980294 RepID=UPI0018EAAE5E|nr:50S ribosomal protein L35 [Glycomyces salinus]
MPKMKTHSGAKKRFKVTGSGKLQRRQQGKNHLMEHKSSKTKRKLDGRADVAKADQKQVRKLLGR